MWKRKIKKCLALGLAFAMMTGVAGCGKEQHLEAEINPDIPVSEVQFPLKEQAELSFITSAPATSTQNPNERIIFKRLEKRRMYILTGPVLWQTSFPIKRIWHWHSLETFRMVCLMQE